MITRRWDNAPRKIILILTFMAIIEGCTSLQQLRKPSEIKEIRPGILAGYLNPKTLPDSLAILPPPPAQGSAALALDAEVSRKSLALRGTQRWELAISDAELKFPEAAATFACALGIPITKKNISAINIHLQMLTG